MVQCPICSKSVKEPDINKHIDSNCAFFLDESISTPPATQSQSKGKQQPKWYPPAGDFFQTPIGKKYYNSQNGGYVGIQSFPIDSTVIPPASQAVSQQNGNGLKRSLEDD